jgi:Kelch motif protein/galactose oxidase-like protein
VTCLLVFWCGSGRVDGQQKLSNPVAGSKCSPGWHPTSPMSVARQFATATLLLDGTVLVVGGTPDGRSYLASAEIYDPSLGTWSETGSLTVSRMFHTATLLTDGRVLVAGGYNQGPLASAEIYDPDTGVWTETGSLEGPRDSSIAQRLEDGRVLVAAGAGYQQLLATAELYDPCTGTWSSAGSLTYGRNASAATLLPNGDVLVAGRGFFQYGEFEVFPDTEIYHPESNTWTLGPPMNRGRFQPAAIVLPSGAWLVAGSRDIPQGGLTSEFYNQGVWTMTGSFQELRNGAGIALLADGRALATGGWFDCFSCIPVHDTAELYDENTGRWELAPGRMAALRYAGHMLVALPDGTALVAGGYTGAGPYLELAEIFCPPERD